MRWLLITTIGKNPGIREVDPDREYILLDKESPSMRKTQVTFDKCIWCGMPVFWSQEENQNCRISWWQELMLGWPSDRKNDFMVLGAGSFFPWGRELETVSDRQQLIQSAEDVLQRSFCVTARDEIVPRVTERPIPHIICPAVFSILDYKKSHELKLANIMPNGAHYTSFGPREAAIWNEKKHSISDILRNNGFVFVAHSLAELQFAQKCGWDKIIPYNGDPYGLLEYYGRCGKYFGNRVHGAIVARGNDADTWSVGYDSRQEAVRLSGSRVSRPSELDINEIEDWASREIEAEPFDMKSNFDKHVDIVRRCTLAGSRSLSDKLNINYGLDLRKGFVNTIQKLNPTTIDITSSAFNISSNLFNNLCNDISIKQRVLNIISRLTGDHWLDKNIEMFKEAIKYKSQWFETLSFLNWYADSFKPGNYLEIGVRRGRSMAQVLAQSPQTRAYGFDLWIQEYSGTPNPGPDFVISELKNLQVRNLPTLIEGDSHEMLPGFWADPNNPRLCLEHLAPGGALVFDDITHVTHPELKHLWQEYKTKFADYIFIEHSHGHGTGIAFKPPFIKLEQYLRRSSMGQQPKHILKRQRDVLLVRPDSIGDFVIFSGILEHFREIYKDAGIHILVQEHIAELAQYCPHIDEVITFNRKKMVHDPAYSDSIIEELKSRKFDTAIHPVYSRDEVGDFLTLNSGAATKIASTGDESNMLPTKKQANDNAYTRLIPASDEKMLETVRNVEFINNLAIKNICEQCAPKVWIQREDETKIDELLGDLNVENPLVICPFSQHAIKDWPLWKWAELIAKYKNYHILICGSEKNRSPADGLIRLLDHNNVHNLCGRITLRHLAALLKRSRLCIGVDTASVHIAVAAGCPHVVIAGGGHFGRFIPYSPDTTLVYLPMSCYHCNWRCKYGQARCITQIRVETVDLAVRKALDGSGTGRSEPLLIEETLKSDYVPTEPAQFNSKPLADVDISEIDKDSKYLLTAIVSTYNAERFFAGCLDDLENQTIADRLEIIVVNSGSMENEEAIVREYRQKYNNIVYIKTEQREGIYAAWNRAVRVAQGNFLTNANTDDRHRNDALEIMAKTLHENPDIALVYGDQICTDTPNGTFDSHHATEMAKRPEYSRERLLFGCCVGSQPMWRKSLHDELDHFDESLACAGDWDFWLRISNKYKFKHIPDFLGLYYFNKHGIEHGRKIHSLYERYIVGRRYGNPYISVIPVYKSKDNPLVSVIMPAYNAAAHIAEAIESVLIQNYRNFELIIVDDGSTDDTKDIVTDFKDEKIKYFYKDNGGPSGARNLAISKAGGQYIMPLDADDKMTPDFIARHLHEFEKHPETDLVYCDDYLIDRNDKPIRIIKRPEYTDRKLLIRDMFRSGFPVVPFRTCIRRSVFDKIGFFDEKLPVGEDYDMMRRFVKHGLKICHLPSALYLRRMTENSLSRNLTPYKAKCQFELVKRFTETFRYDELFPDVEWNEIPADERQLHAKCLSVVTYLAIGQDYVNLHSANFYANIAFEQACSELNDCLEMDPNNRQIRELLQKCELGRQRYEKHVKQAVC